MQQYNNTRNKEDYFMQHEEQLTLYDGAKNRLQEYGIKPHISALRQVDQDIADLERKEISLEQKYNSARKEAKDLEQKYRNIIEYLGKDENEIKLSREKEHIRKNPAR